MARPDLPTALSSSIPWDPQAGAIWTASTLTLRRNLAHFFFPSKLPQSQQRQVVDQIGDAIRRSLPQIAFYSDPELSALDRQLILEHFLIMRGFKQPPNGAVLGIDTGAELLTTINLGNHLELHSVIAGNHLDEGWSKLNRIETQVGEKLGFAFHPKFGYLTSDPTECGTGLTASAHLHLPALVRTQAMREILKTIEDSTIVFSGLTENIEHPIGDIFTITNGLTLGISEESIFCAVQSAAAKLLSAETAVRGHLRESSSAEVKDQVSKGFGLLVHAHQLETKEALDLLSLMKLGLAIGLITQVDDETLNALFFQCRKGHLCRSFPELNGPQEIAQKRADFLQRALEGIQCTH